MNHYQLNQAIIRYLIHALEQYNSTVGTGDREECRALTDGEVREIVSCMQDVYNVLSVRDEYNRVFGGEV